MPQAIIDPEEVRKFARNLKQFNSELEAQLSMLHGQLQNLGNTWRDQEHEKFSAEFETTMKVMSRFAEATNEHIPFLLRKAQRIEEYLNQK